MTARALPSGWGARPALPEAVRRLPQPGRRALRGVSRRPATRLPLPLCERCGAPTAWPVRRCGECAGRRLAFASARAAIVYDDAARALVRSWKERGLRGLAPIAAELVARVVARPDAVALVSVPADPDRALKRGEHPATALARELGRRWSIPLSPPIARTGAAPASGRPRARRPPRQRPRHVRRRQRRRRQPLPRRRRLYERRDGERRRFGAAQGGRAPRARGEPREGGAVDSVASSARAERGTRCSSR